MSTMFPLTWWRVCYLLLPDEDAAYVAWKPSAFSVESETNLSVRARLKEVMGWGMDVPQ